jgi:CYTH domain-containing protein
MVFKKKINTTNTEIERKFLVKGDFKQISTGKIHIVQGYLSSVPERAVRVRILGKKAFITVKGKSDETGMKRFEWEKPISVPDAQDLLKLCEANLIEKYRYIVEHDGHVFEVDEFLGSNKGLVLAELELQHVNEQVNLPDWLSNEVTQDKRYYNSYLSNHPYTSW